MSSERLMDFDFGPDVIRVFVPVTVALKSQVFFSCREDPKDKSLTFLDDRFEGTIVCLFSP